MKLGELKTAIRSMKGNPLIATALPDGRTAWVATMKQGLLEMLDTSYEHKGVETGLSLTDGKIVGGQKFTSAETLTVDLSDMPMPLKDPEPFTLDLDLPFHSGGIVKGGQTYLVGEKPHELTLPKVLTLDLDI